MRRQKALRLLDRARANHDPTKWWCCEGCGEHHFGDNPPDECGCGHRYFENWADMTAEGRTPEYDRPFRNPGELH